MQSRPLGHTELRIPPVVFGNSSFGNLYQPVSEQAKQRICRAWLEAMPVRPVAIDTAGKYGAGLALESLGNCLRASHVDPQAVLISNKLGWLRTPLTGPEPTFEPGVWKELRHDARQSIGYDGILDCWRQGCELLGEPYRPQLVSVHDPDDYLAAASDATERQRRWQDILAAYQALEQLRSTGEVRAVGVGAKSWQVVRQIAEHVRLDWVMLAGDLTIYRHPPEVVRLVRRLAEAGIAVINAAVFQSGFLLGGPYLDYRRAQPTTDAAAFAWRSRFLQLCDQHQVSPAAACIQFAMSHPGVTAVALNATTDGQVFENLRAFETHLPPEFWNDVRQAGLIDPNYPPS